MKLAMRQLSTQQPLLIDDSPVIQTSSIVRRCCFHNRNHCVVQNEKDPYQRSVLIRTIIHELDSYDKKKEFYLTEFLSCLYFAIPSFRSHFIDAFHLVLLDQVELCVEYEERCNVGELSQFIINTRNTQAQELDARWSDGNSPDFDSAGFGLLPQAPRVSPQFLLEVLHQTLSREAAEGDSRPVPHFHHSGAIRDSR